jgi:hypothetical protein
MEIKISKPIKIVQQTAQAKYIKLEGVNEV